MKRLAPRLEPYMVWQEGEDDETMREAAGDLAASSSAPGAVVGLEECLDGLEGTGKHTEHVENARFP